MGDAPLSCVLRHLSDSAYCKAGLIGAGRVVQASVQNATVMARLMLTDFLFLFEYANSPGRFGVEQLVCCGQSNDPASYDRNAHWPIIL